MLASAVEESIGAEGGAGMTASCVNARMHRLVFAVHEVRSFHEAPLVL
jgi:hypothetical protein